MEGTLRGEGVWPPNLCWRLYSGKSRACALGQIMNPPPFGGTAIPPRGAPSARLELRMERRKEARCGDGDASGSAAAAAAAAAAAVAATAAAAAAAAAVSGRLTNQQGAAKAVRRAPSSM